MLKILPRHSLRDSNILNAPEQTIVVTINTVGAMGRGVALACREQHPSIYQHYRKRCKDGLVLGNSLLSYGVSNGHRILLFPTKLDWKDPSPPELIIANLIKLADSFEELDITSLAVPPLGQANGWLHGENKARVQQAMIDTFTKMTIPVVLYTE